MSGKRYKQLNAELTEAISQNENGHITDAELRTILKSVYDEYNRVSANAEASKGEYLLKKLFSN